MLELKNVTKIYAEGTHKRVVALSNATLAFRESEFVSILGPSGCGKSTMLNIIGGLDRYTDGEVIVDGVNTCDFTERDWDTYRNRKIGFVFQSYNLIAHQTVLENVELALTLSGVSAIARKRLAMNALEKVGLANHLRKKPTELSGGEMQRVAIARAIVNDPEVILADEPTGALDSKTSVQIMDLLKDISKEKLVIMVTHNDSLANAYSTRIIKLLDSKIIADSNPFNPLKEREEQQQKSANKSINLQKRKKKQPENELAEAKKKHTSMSFWLSLSLSLKNLLTKKTRTGLTSIASSIGIVGLALVLALFNGLNIFLAKIQQETLSAYPMYVSTSTTTDVSQYISIFLDDDNYISNPNMKDKVFVSHLVTQLNSAKIRNKITLEFQDYLNKMPTEYGTVNYSYGTSMNLFKKKVVYDTSDLGIPLKEVVVPYVSLSIGSYFKEIVGDQDLVLSQYDMIAGSYPTQANELCLVLDKNNRITDTALMAFLMDINANKKDENGEFIVNSYEYDKFLGELLPDGTRKESVYGTFSVALNNGLYRDTNSDGIYEKQVCSMESKLNEVYGAPSSAMVNALKRMGITVPQCYNGNVNNTFDLKITCILRLKEETTTGLFGASPIGYTPALTEYLRQQSKNSAVVKEQEKQLSYLTDGDDSTTCINVLNGNTLTSESAVNDAIKALGYAELPTKVEFYANSFENKENIKKYIAGFNQLESTAEENKISVTDVVSAIIDVLQTFVNIITYVLLALTAISLIVAAIMIAIITYVSVIERTREIGILRSIGARKIDVMSVFNAETVIIGLVSGVIGILLAIIIQFPLNLILKSVTGVGSLVVISPVHALILIGVSILVTLLSGMIPAFMASKKDPVKALRSE